MFNIWGPTIGTAMIISLEEYIRVSYGTKFIGVSEVVYGIALITLIIFLPKGLYGTLIEVFRKKQKSRGKGVIQQLRPGKAAQSCRWEAYPGRH